MKRKLLVAALAAAVLLAASPAFAHLSGAWEGTGTGYCYPRSSIIIYPWQDWQGQIPNAANSFTGTWNDALGNHGTFKGSPAPSIPEIAVFKGTWTWFDPDGSSTIPVYGGDFTMTFYILDDTCAGTWTTIWPTPYKVGTMRGAWVTPD